MKRSNVYYWLGFIAFFTGYLILEDRFGWIVFAMVLVWIGSMYINAHVNELEHERRMKDLDELNQDIETSLDAMKEFREGLNKDEPNENDFIKRSEQ